MAGFGVKYPFHQLILLSIVSLSSFFSYPSSLSRGGGDGGGMGLDGKEVLESSGAQQSRMDIYSYI